MREVALGTKRRVGGPRARKPRTAAPRYWAFLSYSHKDSAEADWLHDALERYRVPRGLVGKKGPRGIIPAGFSPIFRDRQELAASGDLGHTIREALAASRCLIVLCSPEAASSRWANEEILAFKKVHPEGCILAAILAGEPFASDMAGREGEECFPPALRQKYDGRGRPTGRRAEPIAADLRPHADGRHLGLLKLVAGMLGVGLDDLVQRDQQRRNKRLTAIAAASLSGMVLTSGLAVFAFDKRDEARDQRRDAEGLVGFMLGDLRAKLEPIGRLDALDAVGSRALAYYQKQDKAELSDEALAQRSKALTMMGEIAQTRGDLDGALDRYREAMAGTGELARRYPDKPETLFDHAQNVFWVGAIAVQRGQLARGEAAMRDYRDLAYRMLGLEPGNAKWQLETKYADSNLGALFLKQRRYGEAIRQLNAALATAELLAASQPANEDFQKSVPETLAWLADAEFGAGQFDKAIAERERQVALLEAMRRRNPNDIDYRERLLPARRALGRWLVSRGEYRAGIDQVRQSAAIAESLLLTEPSNAVWLQYAAGTRLDLARILASARDPAAAAELRAGCDLADRFDRRNASSAEGPTLVVACLQQRAHSAARAGATDEALALARQALAKARSAPGVDPAGARIMLAKSHKLVGDIQQQSGDLQAARESWQRALESWPRSSGIDPAESAALATIFTALGRKAEAQALNQKLAAMGYR